VRSVQHRRGCVEWMARTRQSGRSEAMAAMAAGGEAEVATHGKELQRRLQSLFPNAGGACSDGDKQEGVKRRAAKDEKTVGSGARPQVRDWLYLAVASPSSSGSSFQQCWSKIMAPSCGRLVLC
jgi:hypothetical protein